MVTCRLSMALIQIFEQRPKGESRMTLLNRQSSAKYHGKWKMVRVSKATFSTRSNAIMT